MTAVLWTRVGGRRFCVVLHGEFEQARQIVEALGLETFTLHGTSSLGDVLDALHEAEKPGRATAPAGEPMAQYEFEGDRVAVTLAAEELLELMNGRPVYWDFKDGRQVAILLDPAFAIARADDPPS